MMPLIEIPVTWEKILAINTIIHEQKSGQSIDRLALLRMILLDGTSAEAEAYIPIIERWGKQMFWIYEVGKELKLLVQFLLYTNNGKASFSCYVSTWEDKVGFAFLLDTVLTPDAFPFQFEHGEETFKSELRAYLRGLFGIKSDE